LYQQGKGGRVLGRAHVNETGRGPHSAASVGPDPTDKDYSVHGGVHHYPADRHRGGLPVLHHHGLQVVWHLGFWRWNNRGHRRLRPSSLVNASHWIHFRRPLGWVRNSDQPELRSKEFQTTRISDHLCRDYVDHGVAICVHELAALVDVLGLVCIRLGGSQFGLQLHGVVLHWHLPLLFVQNLVCGFHHNKNAPAFVACMRCELCLLTLLVLVDRVWQRHGDQRAVPLHRHELIGHGSHYHRRFVPIWKFQKKFLDWFSERCVAV